MEKACDGCRNTNTLKDGTQNSNRSHICTCKDRDEKIKIDQRVDQTAADTHEKNTF